MAAAAGTMPDGRFSEQALPARVLEYYPDCDGQPMAVNDTHYYEIRSIREPLVTRYRQREGVYVIGSLLLYYKRKTDGFAKRPRFRPRHRRNLHSLTPLRSARPPGRIVQGSSCSAILSETMGNPRMKRAEISS